MNASHCINLFTNSCDHISTDGKALHNPHKNNTHNSSIRSDEGLTLQTSAFQIVHSGNATFINTFDHRQPKLGIPFIDFVWEVNFELINAKVSCKCRNKAHLPLRTVVVIFSVQSERKLSPLEAGL